jgi:hypothetical protein
MTIEKPTRDRWRALFTSPDCTRGPWAAFHGLHGSEVTCPQMRCEVARNVVGADAALIAEARTGWPMTLDELERAEQAADDLRNVITLNEADIARRDAELVGLRAGLTEAVELARVANMRQDETARALSELIVTTREALDRYARLASAVAGWAKHRYAARLIEAWEAFQDGR